MFEFARWLGSTPLSEAIKSTAGFAQILQLVHLLTAGVVLASVLVITLRAHGLAFTEVPGSELWARMRRWFWGALAVMGGTGTLFIVGEPLREFSALSFWLKVGLLGVGILGMRHQGRIFRALPAGPGPAALRLGSLLLLLVWITIGLLGRFIGYDIAVWDTLSPRAHL